MEHSHHHHHEHPAAPEKSKVTGSDDWYVCPMHPDVIKQGPGKCPKCGMDLVPMGQPKSKPHHHQQSEKASQHHHPGYDKHAGHHTEDFLKRFWICVGVTVPILLLSHMIQQWL
ncbi:MAG TPA: heavy metal-binding domain-containing protein, partial [Saprospiraceae bacterium]|nr:heavy metal-binding domain-containing protein [Saprospiraceae bacterium]